MKCPVTMNEQLRTLRSWSCRGRNSPTTPPIMTVTTRPNNARFPYPTSVNHPHQVWSLIPEFHRASVLMGIFRVFPAFFLHFTHNYSQHHTCWTYSNRTRNSGQWSWPLTIQILLNHHNNCCLYLHNLNNIEWEIKLNQFYTLILLPLT